MGWAWLTACRVVRVCRCIQDERNIFYREYADRSYATAPFFLSYLVSEAIFELVGCMVFTVICIFVIGMQISATAFFVLFFFLFCLVNGESG
jgi:hypothetical protein